MMTAIRTAAMMIHIVVRRVVGETTLTTSDFRIPGPGGKHIRPPILRQAM
jgi:hypothetical protein